jgi:hypothetical protein
MPNKLKLDQEKFCGQKKKPPHNEVVSKSGGTFDLIG